jgi:hypothetical protein
MIYNNAYTPYKIKSINPLYYFFILSFISIQLFEFFLWRNLSNPEINKALSTGAQLLLACQPIASLMLLKEDGLRNALLAAYGCFLLYVGATHDLKNLSARVYEGHLQWRFVKMSHLGYFLWVFFLMFSIFYNKHYAVAFPTMIAFAILYYYYGNKRTSGSLWCWFANFGMIAYAIYLLIIMPYKEHGIIC